MIKPKVYLSDLSNPLTQHIIHACSILLPKGCDFNVLGTPDIAQEVRTYEQQYPNLGQWSIMLGNPDAENDVHRAIQDCSTALVFPTSTSDTAERLKSMTDDRMHIIACHAMRDQIKHRAQGGITSVFVPTPMQSLLDPPLFRMIQGGVVSLPIKSSTEIAMIDRRDTGLALAQLILEQGHGGDMIELTGPESLTWPDIAAKLSTHLGRDIRFSPFPLWAVQPSMWFRGCSAQSIQAHLNDMKFINQGGEAHVGPDLATLIHSSGQTLDQFLTTYRDAFDLAPK